MAPSVTTIITVARAGKRVVHHLIQPAQRLPTAQQLGRDPWLPQTAVQTTLARGANVTRRGLGLLTLLGLTILGFMILAVAVVMLGLGVASGSQVAGWLLLFTLLGGLTGLVWTGRRASNLLSPPAEPPVPLHDLPFPEAEQSLLNLLHGHERALPAQAQGAFRAAVISTRDALRVTAGENMLSREAFDARQTAREDLPELLDAYRSVPPSAQSDQQLLEQLALIEARMKVVVQHGAASQERRLQASRQYLEDKYNVPEQEKPEAVRR